MAERGILNPGAMILGIGESLNTAVFGMFTLVAAGFLWFGLRVAQHWRTSR